MNWLIKKPKMHGTLDWRLGRIPYGNVMILIGRPLTSKTFKINSTMDWNSSLKKFNDVIMEMEAHILNNSVLVLNPMRFQLQKLDLNHISQFLRKYDHYTLETGIPTIRLSGRMQKVQFNGMKPGKLQDHGSKILESTNLRECFTQKDGLLENLTLF